MALNRQSLPHEVAERLGPFYVYMLIDPRADEPFYVGKGTKQRVEQHGREAGLERGSGNRAKLDRIRDIRAAGYEPRIDIVQHHVDSESEAFRIEAALIDALRPIVDLTNRVDGHGGGLRPLDDLISEYGAEPLTASDPPVLFIRLGSRWIPQREALEPGYQREGAGWRPGISDEELFDATRGWWVLSTTQIAQRRIHHVVCVVEGVTRALYEVDTWTRRRQDNRVAFTGAIIRSGPVFDAYVGSLGKRVPFAPHSQNPPLYWPRTVRRLETT
jgi:uncharacterized protein